MQQKRSRQGKSRDATTDEVRKTREDKTTTYEPSFPMKNFLKLKLTKHHTAILQNVGHTEWTKMQHQCAAKDGHTGGPRRNWRTRERGKLPEHFTTAPPVKGKTAPPMLSWPAGMKGSRVWLFEFCCSCGKGKPNA